MKQILGFIFAASLILLSACGGQSTEAQSESQESNAQNTNDILNLGETGVQEGTAGSIEITAHSTQILESYEEFTPSNGVFVIVDISVKNNGETEINGGDITRASLFDDQETMFNSTVYDEFVEHIYGEINPGETVSGQIIFNHFPSEYYELVFGYGLSTTVNELRWHIPGN
ncbi:DUF4352 domain-containing protein [Halalkalibacter alkaliphilus]|uniref:DUF4352 domain-containing protein n=1 Tax=Halalkalibacter alkaliphilus TaxID=2917993 RepID=A0A9X2I824_9BACI|nr:DUF4352 domain-containing protein [Halalkalibacter alkaliphilus]MCL7748015.1 DUF4352 domain-containing protein [Halalkalibacter alkaliphilus]